MSARLLRAVLPALALVALTALPAAASPPDQHDAQLVPASALTTFGIDQGTQLSGPAKCEDGMAGIYPCRNVDLASSVALPALGGATGNDIWGWTDRKTRREYAIMGTSTSTGFVDVTDPENPVLVGVLPTQGTPDYVLWRDIKVLGNYAFIVSEISGSGLQVFDLTQLRGRTGPTVFTSTASYDEFSYAHNVHINEATKTAFVVGSNTCGNGEESGGLHMVDLSDPLEPKFAGCAVVPDAGQPGESNNYSHDVECVVYDGPDADYTGREICLGSNENAVVIYDVTDRANPRVISATTYENAAYTHQGSLTENRSHFIFGDELDEQGSGVPTTTYIMDVGDLDAPGDPKSFEHQTRSIDHNLYIHGNRVFASNYTEGLRILHFDQPMLAKGQLEEIGYFDVVPGVDVPEFAGTWSNYRFPGSGTVVVSTIEEEQSGLFVLRPQLPADPKGNGKGASKK